MSKTLPLIVMIASFALLTPGCGGGTPQGKSFSEQYQDAMKLSDGTQRARRLVAIAEKQHQSGDLLGATSSLAAAKAAAYSVTGAASRASALTVVAGGHARLRQSQGEIKQILNDAAKAIDEIKDADARVPALADLAAFTGEHLKNPDLAAAHLKRAEESAAEISLPRTNVLAQSRIAAAYHKLNRPEEANRVIGTMFELSRGQDDARQRADCLAEVASTLEKMGQAEPSQAAFAEAKKAAEEITPDDSHAYALLNIAKKTSAAKRKDEARQLLSKAQDLALKVQDTSVRNPLMEEIDAAIKAL